MEFFSEVERHVLCINSQKSLIDIHMMCLMVLQKQNNYKCFFSHLSVTLGRCTKDTHLEM